MSQFARSRPTSPAPSSSEPEGASFAELKQRFDTLRDRKAALRFKAEHVTRSIQECRETAQREFGVDSLEALEAFAQQQEAKEREDMAKFLKDLEAEEALVASMEEQLAQIGH